jgi:hypothetical protein
VVVLITAGERRSAADQVVEAPQTRAQEDRNQCTKAPGPPPPPAEGEDQTDHARREVGDGEAQQHRPDLPATEGPSSQTSADGHGAERLGSKARQGVREHRGSPHQEHESRHHVAGHASPQEPVEQHHARGVNEHVVPRHPPIRRADDATQEQQRDGGERSDQGVLGGRDALAAHQRLQGVEPHPAVAVDPVRQNEEESKDAEREQPPGESGPQRSSGAFLKARGWAVDHAGRVSAAKNAGRPALPTAERVRRLSPAGYGRFDCLAPARVEPTACQ